ncbi:ribosome-binding factor A [Rhodothalassium salexigens]|nr:ribosome-binding factor A [Rhodothalassium salexigens]
MAAKKTAGPSKGPSVRQLRVGESLRHTLSDILRGEDLPDRAIDPLTLTVTEVQVSPDLKNATVFIVPLGGRRETAAVEALNRHAKYLRGRLGRRVVLKHTPALRFALDDSFDEADQIDRLLRSDKVRRDLEPAPDDPDADAAPTDQEQKKD